MLRLLWGRTANDHFLGALWVVGLSGTVAALLVLLWILIGGIAHGMRGRPKVAARRRS